MRRCRGDKEGGKGVYRADARREIVRGSGFRASYRGFVHARRARPQTTAYASRVYSVRPAIGAGHLKEYTRDAYATLNPERLSLRDLAHPAKLFVTLFKQLVHRLLHQLGKMLQK